ncbi:hypothetical protein O988_01312 [Pseudogymnoascus sp. VKM F-3808]|nr:hypothetical protein O988_01312 [Pseudogymnoascus sp. VKM F-3808]
MSLKNAAFPASEAFDAINASLQSDEAERKNAIKMGQSVFAFTLKNKAGETDSWHIDLKKEGVVAKGLGDKPTVTLSLSDEDFGKLVAGKANAQKLFMSGKLKVKGDVMKATKMEPILKRAQTKAKLLQEYDRKRSPLASPFIITNPQRQHRPDNAATPRSSNDLSLPPHLPRTLHRLRLPITRRIPESRYNHPLHTPYPPRRRQLHRPAPTHQSRRLLPRPYAAPFEHQAPILYGRQVLIDARHRRAEEIRQDERESGDDDCVRGYDAAERVPEVPYKRPGEALMV